MLSRRSMNENSTRDYLIGKGYSQIIPRNFSLVVPIIWVVFDYFERDYRGLEDIPSLAVIQPPIEMIDSPYPIIRYSTKTDYYAVFPNEVWKMVKTSYGYKDREIPNKDSLFYSDPGKAPLLCLL